MILGSRGRGNSHFIIGESSSSKRQRVLKKVQFFFYVIRSWESLMMLSSSNLMQTEWPPSHKVQESMNASSLGSRLVYGVQNQCFITPTPHVSCLYL